MSSIHRLRACVARGIIFALLVSILVTIGSPLPANAAFQTSGLIANWPGSALSVSSTVWLDSVNSYPLGENSTTYSSANGGYLTFAGNSNSHAYGTDNAIANFNSDAYSAFFWVYPASVTGTMIIADFNRPAAANEAMFQLINGVPTMWEYGSQLGISGSTASAISANQWSYIGFTRIKSGSGSSLTFYVNGVAGSTITSTTNPAIYSNNFSLGEDNRDHTNFYSGRIAQASIWNTALTTSDITNNYLATNGNFVNPSITSSSSSQSLYLTQPFTAVTETNTGGTATYSISPTLPSGLSIDPTTGKISGTPMVASPTTSYTITATNVAGTSTLNFTLTVTQAGLVLSGPATITYRQAATIQATPTGATTVVFYANKKRIPGCVRVVSNGTMVTCSFKPALQGPNSVYATYSIAGISGQSNTISIRATPRTGTR